MSRGKAQRGKTPKHKIPVIRSAEACEILERCGRVLDNSRDLLANLRRAGFRELLARLDDRVLQLAIQPDTWGERMRANLVSEIAQALGRIPGPGLAMRIEDFVEVANIVTPCLLLELGRRRQHIQIELPLNPMARGSLFVFRAGPSNPAHSIGRDKLVELATVAGEALVGLCYFGDEESRIQVEAELSDEPGKSRQCRKRGGSNVI
jgi:hypothetical protein